jgi:hypothetical protein
MKQELAANKSGADTTLQMPKRISQRKIEENLQASKVAALGASLGIVSDILGNQLVKHRQQANYYYLSRYYSWY